MALPAASIQPHRLSISSNKQQHQIHFLCSASTSLHSTSRSTQLHFKNLFISFQAISREYAHFQIFSFTSLARHTCLTRPFHYFICPNSLHPHTSNNGSRWLQLRVRLATTSPYIDIRIAISWRTAYKQPRNLYERDHRTSTPNTTTMFAIYWSSKDEGRGYDMAH